MKKVTEKTVYIAQIMVYLITVCAFLIGKDGQIRYIVLFSAVIISVILTLFNVFILGKRNEQKK